MAISLRPLHRLSPIGHNGSSLGTTPPVVGDAGWPVPHHYGRTSPTSPNECIESLRYLRDHPHIRFALVLVGGDGCWEVLSRELMLRSRIFRRVHIIALSSEQVCELMGDFHPIYAGVEREVLLLVDDHFAHGNLRDWASFTHTAAKHCAEHGRKRLDTEIARNTFALHGGGAGG